MSTEIKVVNTDNKVLNVVILGDAGVGKTSFLNRIVNDTFSPNYRATVGSEVLTPLEMDGKTPILIRDTAGQEKFMKQKEFQTLVQDSDAAIILFDVCTRPTFKSALNWVEYYGKVCPGKLRLVCGNKSDVKERKVSTIDTIMMKKWNNCVYTDISCKDGTNCMKVLETLWEHQKKRAKRKAENVTLSVEVLLDELCEFFELDAENLTKLLIGSKNVLPNRFIVERSVDDEGEYIISFLTTNTEKIEVLEYDPETHHYLTAILKLLKLVPKLL